MQKKKKYFEKNKLKINFILAHICDKMKETEKYSHW